MEIETLKKIIEFLEKEENRQKPFAYKVKINYPFKEDELNVKGDLNLNQSSIESLPNGLRVKGHLWLFGSDIESLPEGLEVGGWMDVSHTYIKSLPDNLYVGGHLWFKYSNIGEIPKNLYVGGELDIEETPLAKKYTDEEIRRNKNLNNGSFKGNIIR
jgi:hypothetical protein